jgi:hypothetical protein
MRDGDAELEVGDLPTDLGFCVFVCANVGRSDLYVPSPDYRYMPDPELGPVVLSPSALKALATELPELPIDSQRHQHLALPLPQRINLLQPFLRLDRQLWQFRCASALKALATELPELPIEAEERLEKVYALGKRECASWQPFWDPDPARVARTTSRRFLAPSPPPSKSHLAGSGSQKGCQLVSCPASLPNRHRKVEFVLLVLGPGSISASVKVASSAPSPSATNTSHSLFPNA